ncbi:uncharacterized protein LOC116180846 [Photinus pyralis]|nr:uncharacterized protein LOC116170094 [Photinus pyralis]XP_031356861.1 uncharacterized protein LOC116180846 [Photinus pyralis]
MVHLSGSTHEEADTRMVLHTVHAEADNAVVLVRDTDVLLLYVHHFAKMKPSKVWIMSGTARDRNFIPIHDICEKLSPEQKHNLLAFHAITGCDSTSKIASITKRNAWKFFKGHTCSLLEGLGSIPLTDQVVANAEEFVIQLYKVSTEIKTGDAARSFLFGAVKSPEKLPPTSDALRLHIRRCHYQVYVWENAHIANPSVPCPENCGWRVDGTTIEPILMTLPPIPASCNALRACGCKGMCQTNQCRCRKESHPCMKICNCRALCLNCIK